MIQSKPIYVLQKSSHHASPSLMCGVVKYRASKHQYFNEPRYSRSVVYGFENEQLASRWREIHASDAYECVSDALYGGELCLNFNRKNYVRVEDPLFKELEKLYMEKVQSDIDVVSMEYIDQEVFTRMVVCYFMAVVYVNDIIQNDKGVVLKGVYVDPFEYVEDPLEVQKMCLDSLELNYFI